MEKKTQSNENMHSEVSNWRDAIGQECIKDVFRRWTKVIEWTNRKFVQFYLACSDEKLDPFVQYMRDRLAIAEENILRFDVDVNKMDNTTKLKELKNDIEKKSGDLVLLIADRFEKQIDMLAQAKDIYSITRRGHDYDQNIQERKDLAKSFEGVEKKIIILTHIGKSCGEKIYEDALKSALLSQFRDGIMEIKN